MKKVYRYSTLEAAIRVATEVFDATGIVLGIEYDGAHYTLEVWR